MEILAIINIIGVFAFAFAGAMRAITEGMDLLGILTLGIVCAFGGGILRDISVNKIPNSLLSNSDMSIAILGVMVVICIVKILHKDISNTLYILIPDALGLASFTSTGAIIAHNSGLSVFGVIILATLTAAGGGILVDLFCCRVPSALKDNFYATCAIAGAFSFYILSLNKVDSSVASLFCSGIVFCMRIMAIRYQWSLPKISQPHSNR